jgi:hypothetical protein
MLLQEYFKWYGYSSFKRKEKPKHLKPTYLSNDLTNIKKNDQLMVEEVYSWIIVFLKCTFDILLFHKINFQLNWIRIYECLQEIICGSLLQNYVNNMNKK